MNKSKVIFITELTSYILFVTAVYCGLSGIIMYIDNSSQMLINTLYVMIVPMAQYFLKYIKSAISFAVCHLGILAICTYVIISGLFGIMQSLLYSILWIAMFIIFFSIRKSEKNYSVQIPSVAPIAVMILIYFITSGKATRIYDTVISVVLIVSIIVYFINLYIADSYLFFEGNIASGVMNYKKSMGFSSRLMMVFVVICAAIMGTSVFLPSFGLVEFIKKVLFAGFKWVVNLFATSHSGQLGKRTETAPKPEPTVEPTDIIVSKVPQETHTDPDVFFKYIYIFLAVAAIILILFLIFAGLKTLDKKPENEERYFISPFADDEEDHASSKEATPDEGLIKRLFSRNPNRRVRRAFKKAISVNVDLGEKISSCMTPDELCNATSIRKKKRTTKWDFMENASTAGGIKADSAVTDDLETLKKIYEKARYSNTPCSKEEASTAESIQKTL